MALQSPAELDNYCLRYFSFDLVRYWMIFRDEGVQLASLKLVHALLRQLKTNDVITLLPTLSSFVDSQSVACRAAMYDICMWLYDNYSNSTGSEAVYCSWNCWSRQTNWSYVKLNDHIVGLHPGVAWRCSASQILVVYPPTGSRPPRGRWAPCLHSKLGHGPHNLTSNRTLKYSVVFHITVYIYSHCCRYSTYVTLYYLWFATRMHYINLNIWYFRCWNCERRPVAIMFLLNWSSCFHWYLMCVLQWDVRAWSRWHL